MAYREPHVQCNIKIPKAHAKQLKADWKRFCQGKTKLSFNQFLAGMLKPSLKTTDPLAPKVPIGTVFEDDRGYIENILNRDIRAVALIHSSAGTIRSQHWHKSDWHYLYVVSGSMLYSERSLDGSYSKTFKVEAGEMVFTGPGLVHKTEFLEDTLLLSMGNYVDHDADSVKEDF